MTANHFEKVTHVKSEIPFRTDKDVETDIANVQLCNQDKLSRLIGRCKAFLQIMVLHNMLL